MSKTFINVLELSEYANMEIKQAERLFSGIARYVEVKNKMTKRTVKNRGKDIEAIISVRYMSIEDVLEYLSRHSDNKRTMEARVRNSKIFQNVLDKIKKDKKC